MDVHTPLVRYTFQRAPPRKELQDGNSALPKEESRLVMLHVTARLFTSNKSHCRHTSQSLFRAFRDLWVSGRESHQADTDSQRKHHQQFIESPSRVELGTQFGAVERGVYRAPMQLTCPSPFLQLEQPFLQMFHTSAS